jgi:hypothetical protein
MKDITYRKGIKYTDVDTINKVFAVVRETEELAFQLDTEDNPHDYSLLQYLKSHEDKIFYYFDNGNIKEILLDSINDNLGSELPYIVKNQSDEIVGTVSKVLHENYPTDSEDIIKMAYYTNNIQLIQIIKKLSNCGSRIFKQD